MKEKEIIVFLNSIPQLKQEKQHMQGKRMHSQGKNDLEKASEFSNSYGTFSNTLSYVST